jgi:FixJ family two-component response regulator
MDFHEVPAVRIVIISSIGVMNKDHVVFIVDDDARIREALIELLESHHTRAMAFGSAGEYIGASKPDLPACLVLDVELPDINGLDFQGQIADGNHPPIVFITGHGNIPSSVRAIKRGAVDFLTKPFSDTDFMAAIHSAIARDKDTRAARAELTSLRQRYDDLTPRERDVLPLVVSGLLNKQAAAELGISEVTLQIHRRNVMKKMQAGALTDLVRFAEKLQIPATRSRPINGRVSGRVRKMVAVVDDDPRIRESLEDLLESAQYDVRVHSSGRSLLVSGLSNIDCLITDIGMPVMDGFELRDRVRQLRPKLPVFLITGRRDLALTRQDDGQGETKLFSKPFDGPALIAAIANALSGRE